MENRRRERVRLELLETVEGFIKDSIDQLDEGNYLERLVGELVQGKTNPQRAALEITSRLAGDLNKLKNRGQDGL
jgi:hypothetical protein